MEKIKFKKGQVCTWDPKTGYKLAGKPVHIVGVNYITRYVCTNFWEDWRRSIIKKDLENISKNGLNAVRVPFNWEFSEPFPGKYSRKMTQLFGDFLDMSEQLGLFVVPFFLVGTATQMYDVAWRNCRSFIREPMTTYAADNIKHFVGIFKKRPNILCWDVCDEPEWYSRMPGAEKIPYDRKVSYEWMKKIYNTVKKEDPKHCVNLGVGALSVMNYGIHVKDVAEIFDNVTLTTYPGAGCFRGTELLSSARNNYRLGWDVRFHDLKNKGIFSIEAPGGSHVYAGEEVMGKFYRVSLYSNLVNGALGTMPWVWNDFDASIQTKGALNDATAEPYFGISRKDGSLKPAGKELCSFGQFVKKVKIHEWKPEVKYITVLMPENYYDNIDHNSARYFHSYIFTRQAGLNVRYAWEEELKAGIKGPVFIPSIGKFTTKTWITLKDFVKKGGTLYCSYSGHLTQLSSVYNEIFGIEVQGGETQRKPVKVNNMEEKYSGTLDREYSEGQNLLVVTPVNARVLAETDSGLPFALVNSLGKGKAYLVTYPIEATFINRSYECLADNNIHNFYFAVAECAGIKPEVISLSPEVELGIYSKGKKKMIIVINHADKPVTARLNLHFKASFYKVFEGETKKIEGNNIEINIPQSGVKIIFI